MFGYVRPDNRELRMREYECYRAYYCGLCRAMGHCTGQCSRLTLSYDTVFLVLVRTWFAKEEPVVKKRRCLPHPFRARSSVERSPQLDYCADASALLTYHKLADDRRDERGARRLKARLAMLFLRPAYRKAKKSYPALDSAIAAALTRLAECEGSQAPTGPDYPASIFGDLMQAIFTEGLTGTPARLAGELGQALGRWIYLTDAADDLAEDRKRQRYNPYNTLWGNPPTDAQLAQLSTALTANLCDAERAFLLMDAPACPEQRELIANILYLGLPQTAARVLRSAAAPNHSKTEKETSHE